MNVFKEEYPTDARPVCRLYTADVWAVSLGREVCVVIVNCFDSDKKKQSRKVFLSTNLSLPVHDIMDIYSTRFQLEFVFRDASSSRDSFTVRRET